MVAVPKSQSVGTGIGYGNTGSRADAVTADAPEQAWKRLSAGDGAKGPRLYDWAMATLTPHADDHLGGPGGFQRWLLVRRSLRPNDQGELELAFYLCFGPAGTPLEQLVRIAGSRWAIEECFQSAKNEVGMDQYQVRRYDGWHRHITLAMLAHAYLAVTTAHPQNPERPGPPHPSRDPPSPGTSDQRRHPSAGFFNAHWHGHITDAPTKPAPAAVTTGNDGYATTRSKFRSQNMTVVVLVEVGKWEGQS